MIFIVFTAYHLHLVKLVNFTVIDHDLKISIGICFSDLNLIQAAQLGQKEYVEYRIT